MSINVKSKPLDKSDISGSEFAIEMLKGDVTFGINFDRIQYHKSIKKYVILEYLLCDEKQFSKGITPYTSHPNKYFFKNKHKFLSLWKLSQKIEAILFFVNYSKKNTEYDDQILLMKTLSVSDVVKSPVSTEDKKYTREQFSAWLRQLNKEGSI
jgi:hypothetical protein